MRLARGTLTFLSASVYPHTLASRLEGAFGQTLGNVAYILLPNTQTTRSGTLAVERQYILPMAHSNLWGHTNFRKKIKPTDGQTSKPPPPTTQYLPTASQPTSVNPSSAIPSPPAFQLQPLPRTLTWNELRSVFGPPHPGPEVWTAS